MYGTTMYIVKFISTANGRMTSFCTFDFFADVIHLEKIVNKEFIGDNPRYEQRIKSL